MPAFFRFREILKSSSAVKSGPIIEKKQFASLECESGLDFFAFAYRIEKIQGFSLKSRKAWALVILVRPVNEHPEIGTGEKVLFPREDRLLAVGHVVSFVDDMSLVGERPAEDFVQIRSFRAYDSFHRQTAHHMVFSPFFCRLQAEESIRRIDPYEIPVFDWCSGHGFWDRFFRKFISNA